MYGPGTSTRTAVKCTAYAAGGILAARLAIASLKGLMKLFPVKEAA